MINNYIKSLNFYILFFYNLRTARIDVKVEKKSSVNYLFLYKYILTGTV